MLIFFLYSVASNFGFNIPQNVTQRHQQFKALTEEQLNTRKAVMSYAKNLRNTSRAEGPKLMDKN